MSIYHQVLPKWKADLLVRKNKIYSNFPAELKEYRFTHRYLGIKTQKLYVGDSLIINYHALEPRGPQTIGIKKIFASVSIESKIND